MSATNSKSTRTSKRNPRALPAVGVRKWALENPDAEGRETVADAVAAWKMKTSAGQGIVVTRKTATGVTLHGSGGKAVRIFVNADGDVYAQLAQNARTDGTGDVIKDAHPASMKAALTWAEKRLAGSKRPNPAGRRKGRRNPGWHPYEVGGVKHWSKPVPAGGRVVVVEPYHGGKFFQVIFCPGEGYVGREHFSNENSLTEAKVTGERAIDYHSEVAKRRAEYSSDYDRAYVRATQGAKLSTSRKAAPRRNPHQSMTEQQASDTIAALGGMGKLRAMIGADNFIRGYETDGTPSLSFKFKGSKTANYARIALDPSDTYTLRLFKIRGYDAKPVYEASDLYAENLRPAFERATGLYLSLGTMKGNPKKGAARKVAKRNPDPTALTQKVPAEFKGTRNHLPKTVRFDEYGAKRYHLANEYGTWSDQGWDTEKEAVAAGNRWIRDGITIKKDGSTAQMSPEARAMVRAATVKPRKKPLSAFKQHPYLTFSDWQGGLYQDQNDARVVSEASGVPLATIQAHFRDPPGEGEDDSLVNTIENTILERYGSPWKDNPSKGRARKAVQAPKRPAAHRTAKRNPAAGVKATIYMSSAYGAITKVEGTATAVNYSDAGGLQLYYVPKGGKRERLIMSYYTPFIFVVKGWGHPTPGDGFTAPVAGATPGVTTRRSRYMSHDDRWVSDFMTEIGHRFKPILVYKDSKVLHNELPIKQADEGRW